MATRIIHVDDLDGSEGAESVRFALAETTYEIDLSEDNLQKLYKALEPFMEAGRQVSDIAPAARRSRQSRSPKRSGELEEIRQWARANGHRVGSKGRIPRAVQEAYDAASS